MHSQIITQKECSKKMTEYDTLKKRKLNRVPRKKKKEPEPISDTTSEEEIEEMESDSADDISFTLDTDKSDIECEDDVHTLTLPTDPPVITDDSVGKYYAVYYTEPRTVYYWGKITKTFVEIDCLRKKNLSSDPKKWTWIERIKDKDIVIVDTEYIFYGPEVPVVMRNIMRFPDEMAYARLKVIENNLKENS